MAAYTLASCKIVFLSPDILVEEKLEEGKCIAMVIDVVWHVLGADTVLQALGVYLSNFF